MSNVLGICSVCGICGDLSAIQIHFNESHIICEDENFTEGDEDENANGTIAAGPSISGVNKMQWSEKSIKLLLALYKEHLELFMNSKKTNKSIWSQISGKMVEQGYTVTWEDCDIKFRNLKKTYKRIKDNNKLTGRGAKQWTYFNILDELFGTDADINPPFVINNSVMDTSNKDSTSEELTDLENMKGTNEKPRRKRQSDDEPTWLKRYRADAAQRHEEKMQLLRDLIGTLKEKWISLMLIF